MLRIILGIIIGFIAWSVLWVGSDAVFGVVSPEWKKNSSDFQAALANKTPFVLDSWIFVVLLIKSFVVSIISGFIAAQIGRENNKSTFILGILLLVFGIFIQSMSWNYMPLWYHIPFLLMLIPMTILGGRIRRK